MGNLLSEKAWVTEYSKCNAADLCANIAALKVVPEGASVVVHSDSSYIAATGATLLKGEPGRREWMRKFRYGQVPNQELWLTFEEQGRMRDVRMEAADRNEKERLRSRAEYALHYPTSASVRF